MAAPQSSARAPFAFVQRGSIESESVPLQAPPIAAGSALRGSRLLRSGSLNDIALSSLSSGTSGLDEEVSELLASSAPALVSKAAKLQSYLEAQTTYASRSALGVSSSASSSAQVQALALQKRAETAEQEVVKLRTEIAAAKEEARILRMQLAASKAETKATTQRLQTEISLPPPLVLSTLGTCSPEDVLRQELGEMRVKLQSTASAWAQATARNGELQKRLERQQRLKEREDAMQQLAKRYEEGSADLAKQLSAKQSEVLALKEKLKQRSHELQVSLDGHRQKMADVTKARELERVAAEGERRNTELADQLSVKRREVASLRESLEAKSREVDMLRADQTSVVNQRFSHYEAALGNAEQKLQLTEARHRELETQLQSQQEHRCAAAGAEARATVQIAELVARLDRQQQATAASLHMLQAAGADCDGLRAELSEQERAGDIQAGLIQGHALQLEARQQEFVVSWRTVNSEAIELQLDLERQHEATVTALHEHEFHLQTAKAANRDLLNQLNYSRHELEEVTNKLSEAENKLACHESSARQSSSELLAQARQCMGNLEEKAAKDLQAAEEAVQEEWANHEEETKTLGESFELAEQLAESHERRNSELSEQLAARRRELVSLKVKLGAVAAEHAEGISQQEFDAEEAAAEAAGILQRVEAEASHRKHELRQLQREFGWQHQEQMQAEACLQEHLRQATQLQAVAQLRAESEAEAASNASAEVQQLLRSLEERRSSAQDLLQLQDEFDGVEERLEAMTQKLENREELVLKREEEEHSYLASELASRRALQEELLAAELASQSEAGVSVARQEEMARQLQATQEGQQRAEARLLKLQSEHEAVLNKLGIASACLEASEKQNQQLERRMSAQVHELDPTRGHPSRGVSVHHMSTVLMGRVRNAGLGMEASMAEVEAKVLRCQGEAVTCPRDGRPGASYADSVNGADGAGLATHLLGCCPTNTIGEVVGALEQHCSEEGLNSKQVYVWTCSLCINLHRPLADSTGSVREFNCRLASVQHVLFVMAPWSRPKCLGNLRGLCELSEAHRQAVNKLQIAMLIPPEEVKKLREDLRLGGHAIDVAWNALHGLGRTATAVTEAEHTALQQFLGRKPLEQLTQSLHRWLASNLEQQLRSMIASSELWPCEPTARIFDAVGWMLWEVGLRDRAGELLQDGLQLSLEAAAPGGRSTLSKLEVNKAMTNLEVFQLAGSIFERTGEQDTPSIATLLTHMGVARGDTDDHQGALEAFWHARRIRKVTGTIESIAGAVLLGNMAYTFEHLGDSDGASEMYDQALRIRRLTGSLDTPAGARLQQAASARSQGQC